MYVSSLRSSSHPLISHTILVCIVVGMAMLLALVLELSSPLWSRPALILQACALMLALILYRARDRRARLYLGYPLVLGLAIYLWDATLPPPTLPEGVPRIIIPKLVILGILAHMIYIVLQARVVQSGVRVISGYADLDALVAMFSLDAAHVREQLRDSPISLHVTADGREYVNVIEFMALVGQPPHTTGESPQD